MTFYPDALDVRPLTSWPGELTPAHKRTRSPFSATLGKTLRDLDRELAHLGCRHAVMEVAVTTEDFRLDGRPRSGARAAHPGVVLSLPKTNVGPLRYATDLFWTWQDNLRAIALGMDALRRVDRYGITRRGEQYTGFKALPSGSGIGATHMTAEVALKVISDESSINLHAGCAPDLLSSAIRKAKASAHPDRNNGDRSRWDAVEQAALILGRES